MDKVKEELNYTERLTIRRALERYAEKAASTTPDSGAIKGESEKQCAERLQDLFKEASRIVVFCAIALTFSVNASVAAPIMLKATIEKTVNMPAEVATMPPLAPPVQKPVPAYFGIVDDRDAATYVFVNGGSDHRADGFFAAHVDAR